jgi:hypothetical protein
MKGGGGDVDFFQFLYMGYMCRSTSEAYISIK